MKMCLRDKGSKAKEWVLQLCHGYEAPFDDVARQWRALFDDKEYNVLTVFLLGKKSERVSSLVGGEVRFLEYQSKDLKGLKRKQIKDIRVLHKQYNFSFVIAHRYKPIYISSHLKSLPIFGVVHAYGVFDRFFRRSYVNRLKDRLTILGVSNSIRDDIKKALPKYPEDKIQTFYNRINIESVQEGQLSREKSRELLGLKQREYIVGNVGRLHPDKDQKTLIKAFAKALPELGDSRLVILGEGGQRVALELLAKSLGIEDRG
jgi:glycosyltransferase involved in cell wall biosynthesis